MQATFTAKQAAELSGLPYPTLGFLRARGIVTPSVRVGGNRGAANVYSFADVVALCTLTQLRATPARFETMSEVARFWTTEKARTVVEAAERAASAGVPPPAQILIITGTGAVELDTDATVLALAQKYESPVLHIVDLARLVSAVLIEATEHRMRRLHREPGPSGREPRELAGKPGQQGREGGRPESSRAGPTKKAKRRKKRMPVPALVREAGTRTPQLRGK